MERAQKKSLTLLSSQEDHITAEYLPGSLNKEVDFLLRTVKDPSEWKLNPEIFQMICKQRETPDVDLIASPVSNQVLQPN